MHKTIKILALAVAAGLALIAAGCSDSRLDQPEVAVPDAATLTVEDWNLDHAYAVAPPAVGETATMTPSLNMEYLGHTTTTFPTVAVSLDDGHAYATSMLYENPPHSTFESIDISDPAAPAVVGLTDGIESGLRLRLAMDMFVDGDLAYVADFAAALNGEPSYIYQLDVSNPAAPEVVDRETGQGNSRGVTAADGVVYDARFLGGLITWTEAGLDQLGQEVLSGTAVDVEVDGDLAYTCGTMDLLYTTSTLDIFDVSDPTDPVHIGAKKINGESSSAWDLELYPQGPSFSNDRYACVVDGVSFAVLDVTDPKDIVIVSEIDSFFDPNAFPVAVEIEGRYAFVAAGYAGLYVYDIINPAAPRLCGSMRIRGFARDIAVDGDLVAVAAENGGFVTLRFLGG